MVTKTDLVELAYLTEGGGEKGDLAATALERLEGWGYQPMHNAPDGRIVEEIGRKFRTLKIFPEEEVHDSEIVAGAALLGCTILLTSDAPMLDAQAHQKFRSVLEESDVENERLIIATPRAIAARHSIRR